MPQSINMAICFHGEKSKFCISNEKKIFTSLDFSLAINTLDDLTIPSFVSIIESKTVVDVGCGDKFTIILAVEPNFKGPNNNLKSFQKQNVVLLNTKWQNLIEFSHKKALFVNNLEFMRKESGTFLDLPNVPKLRSVVRHQTSSPKKHQKEHPDLLSKKQIFDKSQQLIEELDGAQREIKMKDAKSYTQIIMPHEHKGHQREYSRSSKKGDKENIQSLKNFEPIEERPISHRTYPSKIIFVCFYYLYFLQKLKI